MKILMIVPYAIFPPDEGGRVRAYNMLKQLSPEHETMLFMPRSPGNAASDLSTKIFETTPEGRRHQIIDAGFLRRAHEIARREQPDVIVAEYPWPGLHAAYLARRLRVPFVYDAPNVEADRFRSTGSRAWPAVSAYERLVTRLATSVLTVSAEDHARFRQRGVPERKLQIVPNGIDPAVIHPDAAAGARVRDELGVGAETRMLLFFGQLSYAPNREAVDLIAHELVPRLDAMGQDYVFVIAGKNGEQLRSFYTHQRMRFTGAVSDIAPHINAADAVAVPVSSGGGTRLKVLESIACARPVVSTTVGAEGIDRAACGEFLTVVDGWDDFAEALVRPASANVGNVPAPFLDMYSWANIVKRIEWPAGKHGGNGRR